MPNYIGYGISYEGCRAIFVAKCVSEKNKILYKKELESYIKDEYEDEDYVSKELYERLFGNSDESGTCQDTGLIFYDNNFQMDYHVFGIRLDDGKVEFEFDELYKLKTRLEKILDAHSEYRQYLVGNCRLLIGNSD